MAHEHGHGRQPEQLGPSADPASRRHAVRHQRRERRVRARRRHGRDPLDLPRQPRSARRRADGPLEPRRHDGRGQDLRRHDRRDGSSRSISARATSSGPSKPSAGRTVSASRARRCTTTAWSSPASRAARWRAAAASRRSARKTASSLWTFNTVPGPGEFGHDTWPQDSNAWQFGGAPVWQTPAVDPELGLVYFSTGNPGPDLHGGVRPGDNLFSVSIVAVDAQHRQISLALPASASRHLGLRLAESRRAVRRARERRACAKASCRCRRRAGRTFSIARRASR